MKSSYIVLLFITSLLFCYNSIFAQSRVDSLLSAMENADTPEKIHLYIELFVETIYQDPIKAREYSEKALELSKEIKNDSLTVNSYVYVGLSYNFVDQWRISNKYYLKALEYEFAKTNSYTRSKIFTNLALNYGILNEPEKAVKYNFDAMALSEARNDSLSMAHNFGNLAALYYNMGNLEKSIEYGSIARDIFKKNDYKIYLARMYSDLSDSYFKMNDIEKGTENFLLAKQIFETVQDPIGISDLYYYYAENLYLSKRYKEALENYNYSIEYCDTNIIPLQKYLVLLGIGKVHLYMGNTQKAEKFLKDAKTGFEKNETESQITECNLYLAKVYAKTANWMKFNFFYDLYEENKNAEMQNEKLKAVTELELLFETEKKEQQIEVQKAEISLQKNRVLLLSILAVFIISGLFFAVFISKKLKSRNSELFKQNEELSKRWNELQGFYMKCTPPEDETKESKTLFQNIIKLFNDEKIYLKQDLNVNLLAKNLNSNVKYISNAIKDQTGMNFNTFTNTYRIENAKTLIKDSKSDNLTMEAIAEECGFNNQTSFYQAFKKNTGLTPTQYRNVKVA